MNHTRHEWHSRYINNLPPFRGSRPQRYPLRTHTGHIADMYQPVQPHAFPLLTYEAYLRAQLDHATRMVNANANPHSTFNPPADAHVAPYHLGSMPPVKVHVVRPFCSLLIRFFPDQNIGAT